MCRSKIGSLPARATGGCVISLHKAPPRQPFTELSLSRLPRVQFASGSEPEPVASTVRPDYMVPHFIAHLRLEWRSLALVLSFLALRGKAAQKESGRSKYATLCPNFQTGKSTRVDDVLEVALRPI